MDSTKQIQNATQLCYMDKPFISESPMLTTAEKKKKGSSFLSLLRWQEVAPTSCPEYDENN